MRFHRAIAWTLVGILPFLSWKMVWGAGSNGPLAAQPSKIFTPNGDRCNDLAAFEFQAGLASIQGKIFDLCGSTVAELKPAESFSGSGFDARCPRPNLGANTLVWDGKDVNNQPAPKGVYLYQVEAGGRVYKGSLVLAR